LCSSTALGNGKGSSSDVSAEPVVGDSYSLLISGKL